MTSFVIVGAVPCACPCDPIHDLSLALDRDFVDVAISFCIVYNKIAILMSAS